MAVANIKYPPGFLFSVSYIATPAISEAPASLALKQFNHVYNGGHIIGPVSTIVAGACYAGVAYSLRYSQPQSLSIPSWRYYGFASVLTLGVIPFTFKFLGRLNYRLLALIKTPSLAQPGEVQTLVSQWGYYNRTRSVALLCGGVIAIVGLIQ